MREPDNGDDGGNTGFDEEPTLLLLKDGFLLTVAALAATALSGIPPTEARHSINCSGTEVLLLNTTCGSSLNT
jgi:hypothetical protein